MNDTVSSKPLKTIRTIFNMQNFLKISSSKFLILCGFGLLMTLASIQHFQSNQAQLNQLNLLNHGVGTCFNRISQTFTALMIKDLQSPYLNKGFMALSDECLNETAKESNPFNRTGKGFETLNKLVSDVHWFHEKVAQVHAPLVTGQKNPPSLNSISEMFSKMEGMKVDLVDQVDLYNSKIRSVQANDEILMGVGLLIFVIGLSAIALKEYNRIKTRKEIESEALSIMRSGQTDIEAMVDQIVEKALVSQSLPATAQVFREYHGNLMERMAAPGRVSSKNEQSKVEKADDEIKEVASEPRTSFKEILVSIQKVHPLEVLQATDVRDVTLAVNFESFEQLMNAAVNKLVGARNGNKKVMISNQIHTDRSVITLFLAGSTFSASELEFSQSKLNVSADAIDMNLLILKEMTAESGVQCHLENKTDRNGNITGMCIRLTARRNLKENKSKNLVSVVRGKKKDLTRELMN